MLHFDGPAGDIRIIEIVKYEDYKRFGSNVKITYNGEEIPKGKDQKAPAAQQPPPK